MTWNGPKVMQLHFCIYYLPRTWKTCTMFPNFKQTVYKTHTRTTIRPRWVEAVVLRNDIITEQLTLCFTGLVTEQLIWLKELVNTELPLVAHRRPTAGQLPVFDSYGHLHHIYWTSSNDLQSIRKSVKNKRCRHCGCCKHNTLKHFKQQLWTIILVGCFFLSQQTS